MMFSIRKLFSIDRYHHKPIAKKLARKIFRDRHRSGRSQGFTLIELLISMLITTVIVSTMLTFTVNIMESDRIEQAKSESQGEVQTALNYISDDLQEAVYIYNADTLGADSPNGIKDQLPTTFADSTPVLVFWKRVYYAPTDLLSVGGSTTKAVGCLEYGTSTTETGCYDTSVPPKPKGSGKYTYSLVAYYLINDNPNGTNTAWSRAARVGRWELKDGIRSTCQSGTGAVIAASCTEPRPISRIDVSDPSSPNTNYVNYWTVPDAGFKPFKSSGGEVETLMKQWTKTTTGYPTGSDAPKLTVLIDFIDDTPYDSTQDDGTIGNSPADTANTQNTIVSGKRENESCRDPNIGVGGSSAAATQRVPSTFDATSSNKAERLSSFYACVNSTQTVARIYLRGNALARLRPNQLETERKVSSQTNTFLSTGNVRAFGRGKLFFQ